MAIHDTKTPPSISGSALSIERESFPAAFVPEPCLVPCSLRRNVCIFIIFEYTEQKTHHKSNVMRIHISPVFAPRAFGPRNLGPFSDCKLSKFKLNGSRESIKTASYLTASVLSLAPQGNLDLARESQMNEMSAERTVLMTYLRVQLAPSLCCKTNNLQNTS